MPYYQQGPEDYYGPQSGFDPFTGRLQGGQLVMQFLQNLQRMKDEKQQREWAGEDRELGKRYKEAQIGEMGRAGREYETPEQRAQREMDRLAKAHEYNLKEIEARIAGEERLKNADVKQRAAEAKQAKVDRENKAKEYRTKRADLEKRYNKAVLEIDENFKSEIAKVRGNPRLLESMAPGAPSPYMTALTGANESKKRATKTLEETKQLEVDFLDEQYSDVLPASRTMAAQKPTRPEETKTIGGVKYYRWSDGKWYPSKEGSQTTK